MATDYPQRSVLVIGKSQLVLDDALAGLRELGYKAEGTNDFADVTARFDARDIDLVVFGGQVPPDLKAELREEISAIGEGSGLACHHLAASVDRQRVEID